MIAGKVIDADGSQHPDVPPANNGSERELRPTAICRKVTGGFRSNWGADLFAAVRSVIGTAARRKIDAYQAIRAVLRGESAILPGSAVTNCTGDPLSSID
jgi:transposase